MCLKTSLFLLLSFLVTNGFAQTLSWGLSIYDFQGRKVFESASGSRYYPWQGDLSSAPLIVKMNTKSGVKTVKLGVKN